MFHNLSECDFYLQQQILPLHFSIKGLQRNHQKLYANTFFPFLSLRFRRGSPNNVSGKDKGDEGKGFYLMSRSSITDFCLMHIKIIVLSSQTGQEAAKHRRLCIIEQAAENEYRFVLCESFVFGLKRKTEKWWLAFYMQFYMVMTRDALFNFRNQFLIIFTFLNSSVKEM